ncbi:MAG: hypothetical protein ABFC94_18730, partial [Syntrophomonas sp.]
MAKSGLARKITTVLIVVSVMAVIATTMTMLLMTRQTFSDYINSYDQLMLNQLRPFISDYYAQHGSDGLQEYLESNSMG